jgi:hypothetical protein
MRALAIAVLLLPALALAQAPAKLGYQGRLLRSDGAPETGSPTISFRILTADTGGSLLWSEDQVLALTDGYYATHLGVVTPINPAMFNGAELFLEVAVNGLALSPRQRIGSTPYAMSSSYADLLDGLDSVAFQRRPAGGISCAANSAIRSIDALGNVVCEADDVGAAGGVTNVTASSPITSSGGATPNIALSTTGCVAGEIWKYQGAGAWSCVADDNTTYSAGTGHYLSGTTFMGPRVFSAGYSSLNPNEIDDGAWRAVSGMSITTPSLPFAAILDMSAFVSVDANGVNVSTDIELYVDGTAVSNSLVRTDFSAEDNSSENWLSISTVGVRTVSSGSHTIELRYKMFPSAQDDIFAGNLVVRAFPQ